MGNCLKNFVKSKRSFLSWKSLRDRKDICSFSEWHADLKAKSRAKPIFLDKLKMRGARLRYLGMRKFCVWAPGFKEFLKIQKKFELGFSKSWVVLLTELSFEKSFVIKVL